MIDLKTVTEEEGKAILARRKYMSAWRKANPEKVREHQKWTIVNKLDTKRRKELRRK